MTIDTSRDAVEFALTLATTNRHITPAVRDLALALLAERDALHDAQPYRYIGRDGRAVLARDIEDQRDALQAEVARLRKRLAWHEMKSITPIAIPVTGLK
jgi:hypothetical protein